MNDKKDYTSARNKLLTFLTDNDDVNELIVDSISGGRARFNLLLVTLNVDSMKRKNHEINSKELA